MYVLVDYMCVFAIDYVSTVAYVFLEMAVK